MRRIDLEQWTFGRGRWNTPFLVLAAVAILTLLPLNVAAFTPITPATRNPGNTSGSFQGVPSRNPITILPGTQEPVVQFRPLELTPPCTPTNDDSGPASGKIYTKSYYVYDSADMYNAGQQLYNSWGGSGRDCIVILDFGQASTMAATGPPYVEGVNIFTNASPGYTFIPNSMVTAKAELFIQGYLSATQTPPTHLTLVLGVNLVCTQPSILANLCHGPDTNTHIVDDYTHHGSEWSNTVNQVGMYVNANWGDSAHIGVQGGADLEVGYNTAANSKDWVNGFAQPATGALMYDFGDAGGCPPTGAGYDPGNNYACGDPVDNAHDPNGLYRWQQSDVFYVAWEAPISYPIPEIYFDAPPFPLAGQWAQLSQFGQVSRGAQPIGFLGVLTQFKRCQALGFPHDPLIGCASFGTDQIWHNTLDPYVALTQLQNAVGQTIPSSTDIDHLV